MRLLRCVLANMCVCLEFVLKLECLGVCLLRLFCDLDFASRCVFSLVLLCLDVYVKMLTCLGLCVHMRACAKVCVRA